MSRPRKPTKAPQEAHKADGGRVSFSVRLRTDQARALRVHAAQASIERREPSTVQAIVEEALDAWLKAHAHLLPKGWTGS